MDYQAKARLVRKTLLDEWDPLGVRLVPAAQDEYDAYIPKLVTLLDRDASASNIVTYLEHVASDQMGIVPDEGRDGKVAQSLIKRWSRSE
jgi:hypothetical protein